MFQVFFYSMPVARQTSKLSTYLIIKNEVHDKPPAPQSSHRDYIVKHYTMKMKKTES